MKQFKWLLYVLIGVFAISCAKSQYKSGAAAVEQYQYADAISYLEKSVRKKPTSEAQLLLAETYLKVNRFEDAKAMFDIATLDPSVSDSSRMQYGQALMSTRRYDDAKTVFDGVLSRNPNNKLAQNLAMSCRQTEDMMRDSSLFEVEPVNLGMSKVYGPVIVGNKMYVSAPGQSGLNDPYTNQPYTDIYEASQGTDGWSTATPASSLNTKYHDALPSFSSDGKTAVFTRSLLEDGKRLAKDGENTNNLQLYLTRSTEEGWSEPELLPFNENGYMFTHPALSADGKTLYFSSDKPGGLGNMDLWRSTFDGTNWSTPENLGGGVNTPGNEVFPSLRSADTLYYASNGHLTLGGLDLMYSVGNGGTWEPPVHISAPVNSAADDFGVTFDSAHTGYFSSDRSTKDQVYSFTELDPEILLMGMLTDKSSLMPLEGIKVKVKNLTDGTEEVYTTDELGMFIAELDPNKEYKVITEDDGYFNVSERVSTVGITSNKEINLPIELEELVLTDNNGNPIDNGNGNNNGNNSGNNSNGNDNGNNSGNNSNGNDNGNNSGNNSNGNDNGNNSGNNSNGNNNGNNSGNNSNGNNNTSHPEQGVGQYPIHNIYWDYNKWDIRPDAEPYLNQLVKVLKDNPNLTVQIQSHCDCRGSNAFNDALSQKRAEAVVDYLISKGIPRAKLQSKGKGKRQLKNNCNCRKVSCTEAEHAVNRRTEFIVVGK